MEHDLTDTISHGGVDWSCYSKPVPVKDLDKSRRRVPIQFGTHKGKTAIQALCPMCQKEGRTVWIRVGIEGGGT